MLDRFLHLPTAPEFERAVIGAVMQDAGAVEVATELLLPDDFSESCNQAVWRTVTALSLEVDYPINTLTVAEAMRRAGTLESAGGAAYLCQCVQEVVSAANVDRHAAVVREKSLLRGLILAAERAAVQGRAPGMSTEEMLETLDAQMGSTINRMHRQEPQPLRVLVPPVAEEIEERLKHKGVLSGIPTGCHGLDQITGGLQPEFIVLAGKTSHGKTAWAVGLLRHVGVTLKIPCALFSIEMTHREIVQRLVAGQGKVNLHDLRNGWLNTEHQQRMRKALAGIIEAPVFIDDTSTLSLTALRVKLRRLIRRHGIKLAVVDYLQLVQPPPAESRQEEVARVARGLKALAKELQIPLVVLSQLTRASGDEVPSLGDLRGSGEIEESAPTVLFVWRKRDRQTHDLDSAAKVIVSKQRNGPLGCLDMHFERRWATFEEPAPMGTEERER